MSMRAGFLLTCFLGTPILAQAQAADEGTVTGIVVEADASHNPNTTLGVTDALVTAIAGNDLQKRISERFSELHQRMSQSPPDGIFTIPGLRVDDWNFIPYKDGYDSDSYIGPKAKNVIRVVASKTENLGYVLLQKKPAAAPKSGSRFVPFSVSVVLVLHKRPPVRLPRPEKYKINLCVEDELHQPVSQAFVSVLEYSQTEQGYTKLVDVDKDNVNGFTDSDGTFCRVVSESKVYRDQYVLTVSKYGYRSSVIVRGWTPADSDCNVNSPPNTRAEHTKVELERPLEASETEGIETTDASHRKIFSGETGRTIEALPLSGMRSYDLLALLAPGVVSPAETLDRVGPSFAPGIGTDGSFVANGLRPRENNFTLDDGDDNDELVGIRRQGFVVPASLSVEAIQEFQVISALPDARFGRAIAGQINVVTKPSVGGLHGNGYGFFTDKGLSARDFFEGTTSNLPSHYPVTTLAGTPVLLDGSVMNVQNPSPSEAPFSRLQTGAAFGFNLHRTFVFLAGEREIQKGRREDHFAVPTVEQRGMFDSGASGLLVDGVPSSPDTAVGDAIFSLYPFPNDPMGPYGRNTYTAQLPDEGNGLRTSVKVDPQIKQFPAWVGFRGNFTREKSVRSTTGGAINSAITPWIKNYGFSMLGGINGQTQAHTFRISGNGTSASLDEYPSQVGAQNANLLLNVTQAGANAQQVQYASAGSPAGAQIMKSLGLAGITTTRPITGEFGQLGMDGFGSIGADPFSYPQTRFNSTFQFSYNGSISQRGSIYSFGAEVRPRRVETQIVANALPLIRFGGLENSLASTPLAIDTSAGAPNMASISGTTLAAMGVPSAVLQTLLDLRPQSPAAPEGRVPTPTLDLTQGSFFVQHERQLKRDLRLTAGLRLDLAGVTDVADVRKRTFSVLYNYEQLLADAQAAEAACGARCSGLSSAISHAFAPNSFALTRGSRFGLGPRLGAAWTALPGRAWSVRGGLGIYTGELQFFAANDARQGFNTFVPLDLTNFPVISNQGTFLFNLANSAVRQLSPGLNVFPQSNGSLNGLTVNPFVLMTQGLYNLSGLGLDPTLPSVALIEPSSGLRNPYSAQYTVGTEIQEFGFVFSLSYVGTRGLKLLRLDTPNGGVNRGSIRFDQASVSNSGIPALNGQLLPPVSQGLLAGSLTLAPTVYESTANSLYNSVQMEVRRQYSHGLQFSSALTYSRAYDDATDVTDLVGTFPLPQNSQNRSEWGRSNFDVPLRFVSSFVWDLLPQQRRALLRGWQLAGIAVAQNGQPFTVNTTFDVNEDGNMTDRLNSTSGIVRTNGRDTTVLQLTPGTSTSSLIALAGQSGAVGRNTFRAPTIVNLDLALSKGIKLGEARQILVRCEAFNALNKPQFGIPQRLLEAPAFGQEVRTIASARTLQLALKFSF